MSRGIEGESRSRCHKYRYRVVSSSSRTTLVSQPATVQAGVSCVNSPVGKYAVLLLCQIFVVSVRKDMS